MKARTSDMMTGRSILAALMPAPPPALPAAGLEAMQRARIGGVLHVDWPGDNQGCKGFSRP